MKKENFNLAYRNKSIFYRDPRVNSRNSPELKRKERVKFLLRGNKNF